MAKILVVDDEKEIANVILDFLVLEGIDTLTASDGEEALDSFYKNSPDLIILDIMLPKRSGIEVCKEIRKNSIVPIIMLSAKKEDTDKALALGIGADDFVTKPFSMMELIARVKANLRRSIEYTTEKKTNEVYQFGDVKINWSSYDVTKDRTPVIMTTKELQILKLLIDNISQVLSKEQIYNKVWGYKECYEMNTVVVHINKIREKLEDNPKKPDYIKTVWGVGYKFENKD